MDREMRAIVLEDNEDIRQLVETFLKKKGYEVLIYPDPTLCPLQHSHDCQCDQDERCADIIITDIDMPNISGLDFLESQMRKGCKIQCIAIMSGAWPELGKEHAKSLGYSVFDKPLTLSALAEWLDRCKEGIDQTKDLSHWFLEEE